MHPGEPSEKANRGCVLGKKRCGEGTDAIKEENLVRTFTSDKSLQKTFFAIFDKYSVNSDKYSST